MVNAEIIGPSVIDSTVDSSFTTSQTGQQKVFSVAGLYWAFYGDGATGIYYATSNDGLSWSTPTLLSASATLGFDVSVFLVATTIYYVIVPGNVGHFLWRYGTVKSDGTISWSIAETQVTTVNTNLNLAYITADSSGVAWVVLNEASGTTELIDVYRYSGGSWSNLLNRQVNTSSASVFGKLFPLSGGRAILWYVDMGAQLIDLSSYNGTTWTSPISSSSSYQIADCDATLLGETVYMTGTSPPSFNNLKFFQSTYPCSSISAEVAIATDSGGGATIQTDGRNSFAIFYQNQSLALYYQQSLDQGSTWSEGHVAGETGSAASLSSLTNTNGNSSFLIYRGVLSGAFVPKFVAIMLRVAALGLVEQGADVFIRETRYL